MGNSRARAVYEAQLPDGFRRPQTDAALESFIRAKYEQKKYVAKEWVPSPAPKVNIDGHGVILEDAVVQITVHWILNSTFTCYEAIKVCFTPIYDESTIERQRSNHPPH